MTRQGQLEVESAPEPWHTVAEATHLSLEASKHLALDPGHNFVLLGHALSLLYRVHLDQLSLGHIAGGMQRLPSKVS